MKFCINTKVCEDREIDMGLLCFLMSLYFEKPITNEIIEEVKTYYAITDYDEETDSEVLIISREGIELVESVMLDSEFKQTPLKEDKYDKMAEKMMELFPKGRKEGTNCMWRDSKVIIARRLRALVKNTGVTLNEDEVIDATKRYIASFNGNYTFMQVLKYFISKKDRSTGDENSQLLSFMENKEDVISEDSGELI